LFDSSGTLQEQGKARNGRVLDEKNGGAQIMSEDFAAISKKNV